MRELKTCLLMFVLLFILPSGLFAADKTDMVVMKNGDQLVGEIKRLEFGQLEFKAPYMASSVQLDWSKVMQLRSVRRFRVEFMDGTLLSGTILIKPNAGADENFVMVDHDVTTTHGFLEVVSFVPLERSIWSRFRGSGDIGLTVHPAQGQTQWNANAAVEFPAEHFRFASQFSSLFSSQDGATDTIRDSFGAAYYHFLSKKWFAVGMTQFLKDNQLNLDLRSTFSGGAGRFLLHSNRSGIAVFGGLALSNEKYFDTSSSDNGTHTEALTGADFYTVRFASSRFFSKLFVYYGINQWGRIRVDSETGISWEIWNDFYWKTSILENYDSRPPSGARRSDFTLTSSFGITF